MLGRENPGSGDQKQLEALSDGCSDPLANVHVLGENSSQTKWFI